jgi:DNA adenine methylase
VFYFSAFFIPKNNEFFFHLAFVGSKAKGADHILKWLNHPMFDNMNYIEPFCGYCHILRRVENKKSYKASDCNHLLITLLKAVQNKRPLPKISEREYYKLKPQKGNTLRRAIACFTYSYCGKAWGGYVDKYVRNGQKKSYSEERKNYYRDLQHNDQFMSSTIREIDYKKLNFSNKLIYCDPPYACTTGYKKGNDNNVFDSQHFWNTVRKWSKNNIVFVSEYNAPPDFKCLDSAIKQCSLAIEGRNDRKEKLFVHKTVWEKIKKNR